MLESNSFTHRIARELPNPASTSSTSPTVEFTLPVTSSAQSSAQSYFLEQWLYFQSLMVEAGRSDWEWWPFSPPCSPSRLDFWRMLVEQKSLDQLLPMQLFWSSMWVKAWDPRKMCQRLVSVVFECRCKAFRALFALKSGVGLSRDFDTYRFV